jgi:hypothetical protein
MTLFLSNVLRLKQVVSVAYWNAPDDARKSKEVWHKGIF